MNNKGFTLIELVATIGLLAVVAIISYVSINKVIEESKKNNCEQLVMSIKSAVKEYISDNRYNQEFINSVSISDNQLIFSTKASLLINNNYLSSPLINPFNNKQVLNAESIRIAVKLNSDYSIKNVSTPNEEIFLIQGYSFFPNCNA